ATAKLQHLPDSAAPGHAMDAGPGNIARDTDELEPLVAWLALRRPPVRAVPADGGNRGEGLDVVDQGRPAMEPGVGWERRLIARLAAPVFQRFQQRGLLAQDVAAGRDEQLQVEAKIAAENALPQGARRVGTLDLLSQRLRGMHVFMAQVNDPAASADHPGADQHALDDQVRQLLQQQTVLERPRLALVGVADNVFLRS